MQLFMRCIKHLLLGRSIFQPLWERLNKLSLYGMNIGGGSNVSDSGERWVIEFLAKHLPNSKQAIIFDVGANVGSYASEVISRLGKKVTLYCFEPSKRAFDLLATNLCNNENVKLLNFGGGIRKNLRHCSPMRTGLA